MRDRFARIAGMVRRAARSRSSRAWRLLALIGAVGGAAARARRRHRPARRQRAPPPSTVTEDFEHKFGDDAVVVLVKGDLDQLGAHVLRPRQAAVARGSPPRQRRGRQGVHRPAGSGPVCGARREPSRPRRCSAGRPSSTSPRPGRPTFSRAQSQAAVEQARAAGAAAAARARRQGLSPSSAAGCRACGRRTRS